VCSQIINGATLISIRLLVIVPLRSTLFAKLWRELAHAAQVNAKL
jgi:hypothetical protein